MEVVGAGVSCRATGQSKHVALETPGQMACLGSSWWAEWRLLPRAGVQCDFWGSDNLPASSSCQKDFPRRKPWVGPGPEDFPVLAALESPHP